MLFQFTFILSLCCSAVLALWPVPVSYTNGSTVLWIGESINVIYNGQRISTDDSSDFSLSSNAIVKGAVARAFNNLFKHSLVPWKFHERNTLSSAQPPAWSQKKYITSLEITLSQSVSTYKPTLAGTLNESYALSVSTDGKATLTAASASGVIYGLETFTQLFFKHSTKGAGIYTNLAPVKISDTPKFGYRGINLDVARNWFPVEHILRTIDALSWNKFNHLHLHMTDSQSWPIEIPSIPELARKGAYQDGLTYSPADIQKIHTYAIARGVEVVIEFDMPGHTTSVAYAFPDLIAARDAKPWTTYCNEPPCGQFKLNSPAVNTFLQKLFADVLPRIKPYTSYFHTGGDEVNAQAYLLDETVRSNDSTVIGPYLQKFLDRNHNQIRAAGLSPIVFEEMLLVWNLTLGQDVVIQTWGATDNSLLKVVQAGHKALFGDYNFWYLDCGKGEWIDFVPDSFVSGYEMPSGPFADWCAPLKNWKLIYSYDPVSNLTAEEQKLVVGGELSLWTEQTDGVNLDDMLWPRASAAGEVLWSGQKDAAGQNRTILAASPRLAEMRERLVLRGIRAAPIQPIFCTQAGNAEECSF